MFRGFSSSRNCPSLRRGNLLALKPYVNQTSWYSYYSIKGNMCVSSNYANTIQRNNGEWRILQVYRYVYILLDLSKGYPCLHDSMWNKTKQNETGRKGETWPRPMKKAPLLSENESQETTRRSNQKLPITQRLRTDLRRSGEVTTVIQLVWLNKIKK